MFISAPVPHLCVALSGTFKTKDEKALCLSLMESISTTELDTGSKRINEMFNTFVKRLPNEKNLIFHTAAFLAYYFQIVGHDELCELFTSLTQNYSDYDFAIKQSDTGLLSGIFLTALLSDSKMQSNDGLYIPDNIRQAVEYIESEDFKVHLEKK